MKRIAILSFIISILAIAIAGFSSMGFVLDVNSTSFPLGVLSTLVCVLVGWQIFQAIDLRTKIDTIDDKLKESREDYDHEISGALYHIYALNYMNEGQYNKALSCLMNGIKEQNKSSNPVYLKIIIRLMVEQFSKFKLSSKQEKSELISLLEQTECKDNDTNQYRLHILDQLKEENQC